jgi:23S rRNA pseudouridine1911/1915/1917 synthase
VERRFRRSEGDFTLLRVVPRTGRKHQIRIHLSSIGHPIVGDKLYGGDEDAYLALAQNRLTETQKNQLIFENHALHAFSLKIPWKRQENVFLASKPYFFMQFASLLS